MVMEMNLLSLNSDGAFRTMMHRRMPHSRKRNSTTCRRKMGVIIGRCHFGN